MKEKWAKYATEIKALALVLFALWAFQTLIIDGYQESIVLLRAEIEKKRAVAPKAKELAQMADSIEAYSREISSSSRTAPPLVSSIERIKDNLQLGDKVRQIKREQPVELDQTFTLEEVLILCHRMSHKDIFRLMEEIDRLGASVRTRSLTIRKVQDRAMMEMRVAAIRVKG